MTLRSRRSALRAVLALLLLVPGTVLSGIVLATGANAATPAVVSYTMTTNWAYGFQIDLSMTPSVAVTSWTVSFDMPDQQVLTNAFYAVSTQVGSRVTLSNRPFNASIPAGGTQHVGIQFANPSLSNVPPTAMTFNGQPATYTPSPYITANLHKPVVREGGSATFTVALSQAPTTAVTVQIAGGNAAVVQATPLSLTFTPANWNLPQTVTLTSPEDADNTSQSAYFFLQKLGGTPYYAADALQATQSDND